jgi:succinylarginine dihydrolase
MRGTKVAGESRTWSLAVSSALEVNFDGLVGPTHHYGGLSDGNVASKSSRLQTSHPRQAALEGLRKMKILTDMGIPQGVFPPQQRPDIGSLRKYGFAGTDAEIVAAAWASQPELVSTVSSASSMWAANAATVSPSADTKDGRVHLTPANLISNAHRAIETPFTTKLLRLIFSDSSRFAVHEPLTENSGGRLSDAVLSDEGAANHMRLCRSHAESGLEVFVYGRDVENTDPSRLPRHHPARQTKQASAQIAATHQLDPDKVIFAQQSPAAIDAGVFHNDVIAIANENVLLSHEEAFVDQRRVLAEIRRKFPDVRPIEVSANELPIQEAVSTYLFNSQLVTGPTGKAILICPSECRDHPQASATLARICNEFDDIGSVEFVDVRQSMRNGGGPACLRLRVVLTDDELAAIHQAVLLDDTLYGQLTDWVSRHYRDRLTTESLGDPQLVREVQDALDELTSILELGSIYAFQS